MIMTLIHPSDFEFSSPWSFGFLFRGFRSKVKYKN